MKVSELIEILQSYTQDMIVVDDYEILEKEDIRIYEEFYNGDSANPNCEVIDKVLFIGY